ncbi:Xanthine/uracil/vitamin C permease [Cordyceps fumosorosea ARSEF 2679]|uniref:Xanthine/uracil/vitamin C permease n=1 Tax=Cordyceps fumosorosea (strain ARSEF 2679) TaxID=1081104 RepID=A0A167HJ77_CORFA|nr:Xanthine/uracil/vitamin C permease [Cordyceps fumosorosea ARSEF 2679]OAA47975.1 Xanthine/uracil/vitamin C permease [Cordyceps fumosorosea ARSEF 2679]
MGWAENVNSRVAKSFVGRWFRLDGSGHPRERKGSYFLTEMRAGLTSFFAMAYILAVNSSIVSESGGTCVCNGGADDPLCNTNQEYAICVQGIKRDVVTATAAISAIATFFVGVLANMPVGIAPGMGLNAYFAYTVVGFHGSGPVPYRVALTAIFVEGFIFFALALFGMRQWLARAIPASIKLATGVGIGFYLTLIGLTYSNGIGVIVGSQATPVELAGCHPSSIDPKTGTCPGSDKMRNPTMWIGIFCGGILSVMLMMYRVKGAIIIGILLVSIISWPRPTPVTYFPYTPVGDDAFNFFKKVVTFHPIQNILNVQEWNIGEYGGQFGLALITFLYVDILDCTGTLYSMARFAGLVDPVTQDFEGSTLAYMTDAICISIGAVFGVPPVTAFVESGAGITEGGKTGLTAVMTGLCFFITVFFAPIFASIPPWATGCVLVIVGAMMATAVVEINWRYLGDAVPAFLTMAMMPFSYSIADGLIAGVMSYIIINGGVWVIKKLSGGRIVPPNYEERTGWTYKIPGGVLPPWMVRLSKGDKNFWKEESRPTTATLTPKEADLASNHGSDNEQPAENVATTIPDDQPKRQ